MKKKIILPTILALSVLVIGVLSTSVSAQDASNYPSIVQKIAERFNLNVSDVEQVFDEERDERRAEMFANFADRLDDLVSEDKLTEAQKEAILDKHEDIQDRMEEYKALPPEERHEKMQALHEEFRSWAEAEGIDLPLVGPFGHGFMRGYHKGYMMGAN